MHTITVKALARLFHKARQLLICSLVLALGSNPTALAEVPVYDVEVVIFSNNNSGDDGEHWPTAASDGLNTRAPGYDARISKLPESSYRLNNVSNSLRHSSGYSVLYHSAWRLPAYDSRNALTYPVNQYVRNGTQHLNGSIKLVRERYLHLDVDLLLTSASSAAKLSSAEGESGSPVFELREKRRIKKSGTVHYFDHPRFGMIATVTPYISPQAQQQLQLDAEMESAAATEENIEDDEPLPDDDQLTR
jgi:hypothetical protein